MRTFIAFLGKEFTEHLRTYKLLILGAVFLIVGVMSPLAARFMPDILAMAGLDPDALGLPNPSALDSYMQFFKNTSQLGMVILVIVFSGLMANELSKGTLVNILTKGLARRVVLAAKAVFAVLLWTVLYLVSLGVTYAYTIYYFPAMEFAHPFAAFFALWLFGVLLLALILFGGVLTGTYVGSLMMAGGTAIVLSLVNLVPTAVDYNPSSLAGQNTALLTGDKTPADLMPAFVLCAVLIAALLAVSALVFNRKQL
jgi:ABC-2 type transport system permease protein